MQKIKSQGTADCLICGSARRKMPVAAGVRLVRAPLAGQHEQPVLLTMLRSQCDPGSIRPVGLGLEPKPFDQLFAGDPIREAKVIPHFRPHAAMELPSGNHDCLPLGAPQVNAGGKPSHASAHHHCSPDFFVHTNAETDGGRGLEPTGG